MHEILQDHHIHDHKTLLPSGLFEPRAGISDTYFFYSNVNNEQSIYYFNSFIPSILLFRHSKCIALSDVVL